MRKGEDAAVLEPLETVLSGDFLDEAQRELSANGFVTDEHSFAPYRETITHYVADIERALAARADRLRLGSGYVASHPDAGYAYFIYDKARFATLDAARDVVFAWLSRLYKNNQNA